MNATNNQPITITLSENYPTIILALKLQSIDMHVCFEGELSDKKDCLHDHSIQYFSFFCLAYFDINKSI